MAVRIAEILECRRLGRSMRTYTLAIPEGMTWAGGANMKLGLFEGLDPTMGSRIKGCDLATRQSESTRLTAASFDPKYTRIVSISTRPQDGVVVFSTRIPDNPSIFKADLATYEVGDSLFILEVNNHLAVPTEGPLVLLTQGVGLSSMHAFIRDLLEKGNGGPIICVNVVEPVEELRDLMVSDDRVQYIFKSNRYAFEQTVQTLLDDNEIKTHSRFVVLGGHGFMKQWIHELRIAGIEDERIFIDRLDAQRSIYFPELKNSNE